MACRAALALSEMVREYWKGGGGSERGAGRAPSYQPSPRESFREAVCPRCATKSSGRSGAVQATLSLAMHSSRRDSSAGGDPGRDALRRDGRRRRSARPERAIQRLLGLDINGSTSGSASVTRGARPAWVLDRVWEAPGSLPTSQELEHPGLVGPLGPRPRRSGLNTTR